MLRILTDRSTEYCGRVEQHDYQLYLAINDIVIVGLGSATLNYEHPRIMNRLLSAHGDDALNS